MRFAARIRNSRGEHHVDVSVAEKSTSISIAPRQSGFGSSVSGGELLMLALATCYCNDVYREAGKMNIEVTAVEVECSADFPAEGAPGRDLRYSARISARASEGEIQRLAMLADGLAEIQNTVRGAIPVQLTRVEAMPV